MASAIDPADRITEIGFGILKALAEYRYLTTNHLLDLGIAKDRGHLGKVLAGLLSVKKQDGKTKRRPKEIGELDFGVKVGQGRLPRMYYLTKRGAETLQLLDPSIDQVRYPPRVVQFAPDYEHRVRTIDFHIALNRWAPTAGQEVVGFRRYYDWWPASEKGRQHPVTRIALEHKNIVPDAMFTLRDSEGDDRPFCYEMANGIDTSRVLAQMRQYARGLEQKSISRAFDTEKAVRVLFVFERVRLLSLVQERALKDAWLRSYARNFFLKAHDQVQASDLDENWYRFDADLPPEKLF